MKKRIYVAVILLLLSSVIYAQNAVGEAVSQRPKLAVSKFKAIELPPSVAEKIREAITGYIVRANKYTVVERSGLDIIMKEIKLQHSDLYDRENAVKLGRLIAARGIIVGSVSKVGNNIVVQARLVDLQTGRIIRSSKAGSPYDENISRVCAKVAYELINIAYDESVIIGEVFLDFPWWKQYLIGINFGVGFGRRLGKFGGYNKYDLVANETKFVQQASLRFMYFFTKTSTFGLILDVGWYQYRIEETGNTIDTATFSGVQYYNQTKLHYLYYVIGLVARYREFHFYGGYSMNFVVHASGKINPYLTLGSDPAGKVYEINDKSIFKKTSMGFVVGAGHTFKNLPGGIKIVFSVEFKFQLTGLYDEAKLKNYYTNAGFPNMQTGLVNNVKVFSLFVNIGILFGL
jgi:TolB-like protein